MTTLAARLATLVFAGVVACAASQAEAADDMPSGRLVSPPLGFIELCERMPAQCVQNRYASQSQLDAVRQWAGQARWAAVFARNQEGAQAGSGSRDGSRGPTATIAPPPAAPVPSLEALVSLPVRPLTLAAHLASAGVWSGSDRLDRGGAGATLGSRLMTAGWRPSATPSRPSLASPFITRPAQPLADHLVRTRWDIGRYTYEVPAAEGITAPVFTRESLASPEPRPQTPPVYGPEPSNSMRSVREDPGGWQPPRFQTNLGMGQLNEINRTINRAIRPVSDQAAFGKAEYWTVPSGVGAVGDCEDYVLAKRQALIEAGTPAEALSIAVVRTRRQDLHTVLLVATADGEVVLDNLSPWIVSWRDAPYSWRERQARGSALTWIQPDA